MKMRYPDGLRGQVSATKTHMVTLAVGSEVVFQGGVSQSDMAVILGMIMRHNTEWSDRVSKINQQESTNGQSATSTQASATGTATGRHQPHGGRAVDQTGGGGAPAPSSAAKK